MFGPYFGGKILSTLGIWIHNVVAAIVVYEMSGSALVVGAVSVAQFGPQIVFAPFFGAAADRGNRQSQIVVGRVVSAIGSGGLALALAILGVDGIPGPWVVVLAALIVGIGFVIGGPAMLAIIPSMVRPSELASAVALNSVPPSLSRAAGPAVGAIVATATSPAIAFGIAGLMHLAFAYVVFRLPIPTARVETTSDGSTRQGMAYLRRDRSAVLLLVGITAIGFGADPAITLTPTISDALGRGSSLVGLLASSFGVGAAIGLPLFTSLRKIWGLPVMGTLGLVLLATGNAVVGVAGSRVILVLAFCLAGIGMSLAVSGLTTQLHQRVTEEYRGRIMGVWSVAFLGSRPIAAAINGALADAASHFWAFVFVAGIVATAAWLVRPASVARNTPP